jgi:hypothetical protein
VADPGRLVPGRGRLLPALSLAAYFTGEFSAVYLYLDLVFIAVGLASAPGSSPPAPAPGWPTP